ncbi:MAG TPA: hypothetical protein VFV34_16615, partial [Blastocatellia bacterium]|nr:hypothetical protein [Blastocatellia bacterium]
ENQGAVRFCRVCGAPATQKLPAEIEIMVMQAGTSAAHQEIFIGLVITFLTLIISLPLIIAGAQKEVTIGSVSAGIGGALSLYVLLSGMFRLHRVLNIKRDDTQLETESRRTQLSEPAALPPQPISVTEGTTSLMNSPEPIPAGSRDTGSVE